MYAVSLTNFFFVCSVLGNIVSDNELCFSHTLPIYGREYTRHMIYNVQKCHHVNVFTKNMKREKWNMFLLPTPHNFHHKNHKRIRTLCIDVYDICTYVRTSMPLVSCDMEYDACGSINDTLMTLPCCLI